MLLLENVETFSVAYYMHLFTDSNSSVIDILLCTFVVCSGACGVHGDWRAVVSGGPGASADPHTGGFLCGGTPDSGVAVSNPGGAASCGGVPTP